MCGIMADMSLIGTYTKKIFPEMKIILEEKEENCGDYIGNNLINQGLTNIFTNNMLNNDTSLLIWDYLFLEGNIILIKSFIGLYACLVNTLNKVPRCIESFQKIINVDLKNILADNNTFLRYLLVYKYEFNEETLNKERFGLSLEIADAFENGSIETVKSKLKISYDKQLKVTMEKTSSCNKKWPYCVNDTYFENVTQIVFYMTLSKQKHDEYIGNYFFDKVKEKIKIKEELREKNEGKPIKTIKEDFYNIPIERRPHYCSQINDKSENEKENGNNTNIEGEKDYNDETISYNFDETQSKEILENKEDDEQNTKNID